MSTNPAPFKYKLVEQGFNYIDLANNVGGTSKAILNNRYGLPYLFQTPRSFRFKIKFSF